MGKRRKLLFWFLGTGLLLLVGSILLHQEYKRLLTKDLTGAESDLRSSTQKTAIKINNHLEKARRVADSLAVKADCLQWEPDEVHTRLNVIVDKNDLLFGIGIAYDPQFYSRSFVYVSHEENDNIEGENGLELPADPWNGENKSNQGWVCRRTAHGWTAVYSCPVKAVSGDQAAVIFVVIRFRAIREWIDQIGLGKTGYGFLVSEEHKLLAHPRQDYVNDNKTIAQLIKDKEDHGGTLARVQRLLDDGDFFSPYKDNSQTSWLLLAPVKDTNWRLGVVFMANSVPVDFDDLRRKLFQAICLFCLGFACCAMGTATGSPAADHPRLMWVHSIGVALVFLMGILRIWSFIYQESFDKIGGNTTRLHNESELNAFMEGHPDNLIRIPTGLYLETFEFVSAYQVKTAGFIWQKTSVKPEFPGYPDEPFLQMPDATELEIDKVQELVQGDSLLIIYRFSAELQQKFDYATYPFDYGEARIVIRSRPPLSPIILTPDFATYPFMAPASKPGLNTDLDFSGWTCAGSYFSFVSPGYNLDFGTQEQQTVEKPLLSFNISLRRNLLDPLIAHLLPLMVVAFFIFGLLLTVTGKKEKAERLGFSATETIAVNSALFFVVTVAHIQLREGIQVPFIIYLEYFYFTIYLVLLFSTAHALMFQLGWSLDTRMVIYLYWPLLVVVLLAGTLYRFY